jgi:hypothetical protein
MAAFAPVVQQKRPVSSREGRMQDNVRCLDPNTSTQRERSFTIISTCKQTACLEQVGPPAHMTAAARVSTLTTQS